MRLDPIAAGLGDLSDEIGYALGADSELVKKRRRKGNTSAQEIPGWKWSVMERIAEYLYQKGPTDTRIITRMYGIRTTQFITTMTYYWPIYEDFGGGGTRSYTIGIRTEPHILEVFREKRKRARYEKD
jgi:hypothetical protein